MGKPERQIIHMAGGLLHIKEEQGRRIFVQEDRLAGTPLTDVPTPLQRGPCELVEFHCMLVQTEVFDRLGPFDEELFSIHEHDDFCLALRQAGGSIYLEPSAVVTYVSPLPLVWSDFPYFTLRWSKEWNKASLRRFHKKWNLDMSEDDPRYDWLWNRQYLLLRPLSRPLGPLQNLIQMVFGRRGTAWMKQTSLSFIRRVLSLFLVHGTRSKTRS
jgi:GT2 family glycosyltransferase